MRKEFEIDDQDLRILDILSKDGRMSWRDLAQAVGLSLTPTLRRVRRLEVAGYIRGYRAILDESMLGGAVTVFISITLERQNRDTLRAFEAHTATLPGVVSGYMTTGQADYLLTAVAKDLHHYLELLDELAQAEGVAHIHSSIALNRFVEKTVDLSLI
ncbi:Lrp/AsnC family transcriptional regulator [Sphingopyxis yananensis]|uniref:Lrp/AsnC family transcriptional regulator n=1 Tax=Sphingopyxis yananensis TaxID=2886687 RepID=UPI001D116871|nr:Lrp/AsnC family transcriptional regulator [Sphingopyxis yananensis]MCC2601296.1 Lrp/AsnC family transcriptional regulator [Sphingopyxis yananensis]